MPVLTSGTQQFMLRASHKALSVANKNSVNINIHAYLYILDYVQWVCSAVVLVCPIHSPSQQLSALLLLLLPAHPPTACTCQAW